MREPTSLPEPWPTGVSGSDRVKPEAIDSQRLDVKSAADLSTVLSEYSLLTPAVIQRYAPRGFDIMAATQSQLGEDVQLRYIDTPIKVIYGVGEPWCRRLVAIRKDVFDRFVACAGTVALIDQDNGHLYRVRTIKMDLPDIYAIEGGTVPLLGFCFDTTKGCYHFRKNKPWLGMSFPEVVYSPQTIFEDTVRFRDSLLAGDQPYGDQPG